MAVYKLICCRKREMEGGFLGNDFYSCMDKAIVVVPCCSGQRDLGVIGPSKRKGQQLPIFGIWYHTLTRSVVVRVLHWQCKLSVITVISIGLCRVMNEDY